MDWLAALPPSEHPYRIYPCAGYLVAVSQDHAPLRIDLDGTITPLKLTDATAADIQRRKT